LTVVLWKYQVFWEIQSPVTTDEVIWSARILYIYKRKVSKNRVKSVTKNTPIDFSFGNSHWSLTTDEVVLNL